MTSQSESLCQLYRRAVRESIRDYQPTLESSQDSDFHEYLRRTYAACADGMRRAEIASIAPLPGEKTGLFVLACGLFAYGELDKVPVILENLPRSGGIRKLALSLAALMPLPSEIDVLSAPESVRQWFASNRERLLWREAEGRYELLDALA